jgi:hypothetical protein
VHALDVGAIDAALLFLVYAAGVEEKEAPRVVARIEEAFGARVDVDAASRIAGADQVRMAVPDLTRLETFPRCADQLVLRQVAGQACKTGIPQALLGPETPGGESAGAREDGGSQEKLPTQASS